MVPLGERDMHAPYLMRPLRLAASFVSTEKRLKGNAAIDPLALARPISSFISKLKKFVRSVVDNCGAGPWITQVRRDRSRSTINKYRSV
jgi:hypothetical protein